MPFHHRRTTYLFLALIVGRIEVENSLRKYIIILFGSLHMVEIKDEEERHRRSCSCSHARTLENSQMTRKRALSSDNRTRALSLAMSTDKKQRNLVGVLYLTDLEHIREDPKTPIAMLDNRERRQVRSIINWTYSSLSVYVFIFPVFGQSTEKQTNPCNKYET